MKEIEVTIKDETIVIPASDFVYFIEDVMDAFGLETSITDYDATYKYKGINMTLEMIESLFEGNAKFDQGKPKVSLVPKSAIFVGIPTHEDIKEAYIRYIREDIEARDVYNSIAHKLYKNSENFEFDLLMDLAEIFSYGASIHSEGSWKSVDPIRFRDALGRHISKTGIDEDSGFGHMHLAMWNALVLSELEGLDGGEEEI